YVRRETRRAVAGVSPRVKIWPGIDIDIPTGAGEKKTEPDDVYAAVKAAFDGGAHGVLLSRKYSEMKLANLRAAGRAVRDLKLAPCVDALALLLQFHALRQHAPVRLPRALDFHGIPDLQRGAHRVLEPRRGVRLDQRRVDLERERVRRARAGDAAGHDRAFQL